MTENSKDPFNRETAFKASFKIEMGWPENVELQEAWLVPYNGGFWFMNDPEDMHQGYDLISIDALKAIGEYSDQRVLTEDIRLQIVERVGILLDTPEMNDFWSHIAAHALDDSLKRVVDEIIHETVKSVFDKLVEDAGSEV